MSKIFNTYSQINEALSLRKYREYHNIRPEYLEQILTEIFEGKNRIYLPFKFDVPDINPDPSIRYVLWNSGGYKITNYLEGYCEKDGRTFRIGKVLNKLNRLDLLKVFNEDPSRAIQNKELLICISKHPYDIAGMSTDRGWTSCMDLYYGEHRRYVSKEIKAGTFIAYLIDVNDKNIRSPHGRVNIKPYVNLSKNMAWGLSEVCYGSMLDDSALSSKFIESVSEWVNSKANKTKGVYSLAGGVYSNEAVDVITVGKDVENNLFEWNIDMDRFGENGEYTLNIDSPLNIKEFKGFEELFGFEIKEIKGGLYFDRRHSLTSVSNLPERIGGSLDFEYCTSLTSISDFPKLLEGVLYTEGCPFFEGMDEQQIREKYNIQPVNFKIREWGILLSFLNDDGDYSVGINAPENIKKFTGFKEELGLNIREVQGLSFYKCESLTSVSNLPECSSALSFTRCKSLESVSNLPESVGGNLSFEKCNSLTYISNLPEKVKGSLSFSECLSLKSVPKMPSVVEGYIHTEKCPFFEGMNEEQIREKYNISR